MSDQPLIPPPEVPDEEVWESAVRETARHLNYPPTPDIAGRVRGRLHSGGRRPVRAWRMAAAVVALLVFAMAVPEVRAVVLEVLRIGVVRIFMVEPTVTPTMMPTSLPSTPTMTPRPTFTPTYPILESVFDLPGETTLADAEAQLGDPILLPTYPWNLGSPDHVFAQRVNAVIVTLVWMQPDDPTAVRLVMQILDERAMGIKYYPWGEANQQATWVYNHPAIWLTDVHEIFYIGGDSEFSRLVDQNVLVWEQDGLTYRLETDLPLDQAVRMAESLE